MTDEQTCADVWEQVKPGDRVIWGYCRKSKGHTGRCGPDAPDHDREASDD